MRDEAATQGLFGRRHAERVPARQLDEAVHGADVDQLDLGVRARSVGTGDQPHAGAAIAAPAGELGLAGHDEASFE